MSTPSATAVSTLTDIYARHADLQKITAQLSALPPHAPTQYIAGLRGGARSVVIATLIAQLPRRPHVLLLADKNEALDYLNTLQDVWGETRSVYLFPPSYEWKHEAAVPNKTNQFLRTEALYALVHNPHCVLLAYPASVLEKVPALAQLSTREIRLHCEQIIRPSVLMDQLQKHQFGRTDFVYEPGQYALRGGIMDIYSYGNEQPYRIEWSADEIVSLRSFDPRTQRSAQTHTQISILPHDQTKDSDDNACTHNFFDILPESTILWSEDEAHFFHAVERETNHIEKADDNTRIGACASLHDLCASASARLRVQLPLQDTPSNAQTLHTFHTHTQAVFSRNFKALASDMYEKQTQGYTLILTAEKENELRRIKSILASIDARVITQTYPLRLAGGWIDEREKISCYSESDIFQRARVRAHKKVYSQKEALSIKSMQELQVGDYVTHIDYGIGVFSGLQKTTVAGRSQEMIRLLYRNKDILYVSVQALQKLSKYASRDATPPVLHALGGASWAKVKERAKAKIKTLAFDLIRLYAQRKLQAGFAFSEDGFLQTQMEASFPFEDTPDQAKATRAVKRDMQAGAPMDRLICGDVGFGKTEIAMRSAFKACCDGKQVAVLVPTTVLAFQHFRTFTQRLADFPVRVEMLSRLKTIKEKKQIVKELAEHKIDILIGTHSILGKGIKFADLGLLITDEEQKFGVSAKESLKALKHNIDCLTLTATPIPRTLQFSLMGARDLSVMRTPPPNRQEIQTEAHDFDEALITEVLERELDRGGQVFFVHNYVRDMEEMVRLVQRLCPRASVTFAHGQMRADRLEQNLMAFINHEYDIFVSTNIVESGIDIPNVNTIIINNAHEFGLSDLHQLRGRVGRSPKKAYCYLLVPSIYQLSTLSRQKIQVLEEFSHLGAGFQIAMKDLDIRGAGNVLGGEQSGFMVEVGMEVYQRLLDEALAELRRTNMGAGAIATKDDEVQYTSDCTVETDAPAFIPEEYMESIDERLNFYYAISRSRSQEEDVRLLDELADRFGEVPEEVRVLSACVGVRRRACAMGVEKIILKNKMLKIIFVSGETSAFYESACFKSILEVVMNDMRDTVRVQQGKNNLFMEVRGVTDIWAADHILARMQRGK